jgi:hypothetical protein
LVQDLPGVAVVAVNDATARRLSTLLFLRCIGALLGSLVLPRVDDEPCLGVPGCCVSTDGCTVGVVAVAPPLLLVSGRTRTWCRRVVRLS